MNVFAYTLLTLWLMPRVALRVWWMVVPIFLAGGGAGLYYHDTTYALWGIVVALLATLLASIVQLQALNGTGWIPPAWFISLVRNK